MIPFTLALTSFALVTLYFSYTSFIGLNTIALALQNIKFVGIFLPAGTPLLIIWFLIILEASSYFVRILSLAIRLFANTLAGHALIKILSSFV
jgi:F0F1-type ATP synthase membrane subunit a